MLNYSPTFQRYKNNRRHSIDHPDLDGDSFDSLSSITDELLQDSDDADDDDHSNDHDSSATMNENSESHTDNSTHIPQPVELTQHNSQTFSTDNNNSNLPCTYSVSPTEVINYEALMNKMKDMELKMENKFQILEEQASVTNKGFINMEKQKNAIDQSSQTQLEGLDTLQSLIVQLSADDLMSLEETLTELKQKADLYDEHQLFIQKTKEIVWNNGFEKFVDKYGNMHIVSLEEGDEEDLCDLHSKQKSMSNEETLNRLNDWADALKYLAK